MIPPLAEPDEPDAVPWLDEAELSDWFRISALVLTLPAALDGQLQRDAGMSFFSYLIMAMLSEAPDRTLQMSQISVLTHGSLSKLSHAVKALERRGWVRRATLVDSHRYTVATLTGAGMDAVAAAAPGHIRAVRRAVIDPLTPDQRRELALSSVAVLRAIGARDPGPDPVPPPGNGATP